MTFAEWWSDNSYDSSAMRAYRAAATSEDDEFEKAFRIVWDAARATAFAECDQIALNTPIPLSYPVTVSSAVVNKLISACQKTIAIAIRAAAARQESV